MFRYDDLSEQQLDVLTEIGNVGSGNASTALSSMIGKNIEIKMPSVRLLGFQDAIESNGSPEDVIAGVLIRMKGQMSGMVLILIEKNFSDAVLSSFFGETDLPLIELDEGHQSALAEISNIMASAYVNAISGLSGLSIGVESPQFTVDMLGAIMSVPIIEFGEIGEKLLCIDKILQIDGVEVKSNLLLIPTVTSLALLLRKLAVS